MEHKLSFINKFNLKNVILLKLKPIESSNVATSVLTAEKITKAHQHYGDNDRDEAQHQR